MRKMKTIFATAFLLTALALAAGPAIAALQAVSPANDPATGFPLWYQDANGLAITECLDLPSTTGNVPYCTLLAQPGFNPLSPIVALPSLANYPTEMFYWVADAIVDTTGGINSQAKFRLALEATFANGSPIAGDQIVFLLINMQKMDHLPPSTTFTVTHPFGSFQFTTDASGTTLPGLGGQGFRTRDATIPVPLNISPAAFSALLPALTTNIGPFLQASATPGGAPLPPVIDQVSGHAFLAVPVIPTSVTGGTNGNSITITGTGIGGPGKNSVTTSLFNLQGRIIGIDVTPTGTQDFGVWKQGATSAAKTFTLTNLFGAPVAAPVVTLPAGYNLAANGCTAPLTATGPGSSCTFDVTFSPAANGIAGGNMTINAAPAPVASIPVTGIGDFNAPAVELTGIITSTKTTSQIISGTVSDASGVSSVQVSVNGGAPQAAVVTGGTWSFSVSGLTQNVANSIAVTATDTAQPAPGNQSVPVTGTITVDNLAPVAAIDPVTSPSKITSQAITGTAGDNFAISSVVVSDNGNVQGTATITGGTWSYNLSGMTSGDNVITATAFDPAGNSATSASRTITVDTVAPLVAINNVVSPTNLSSQTITGTASDAISGLSSVAISLNGNAQGNATITGGTWSYNLSGMTVNASNVITATATDAAGNSATSAAQTIINSVGTIVIDSGAQYAIRPSVTLTLGYSPAPPKMQFSFDNITWKAPVPFAAVQVVALPPGDGLKTVHVRYLDQSNTVLNPNDVFASITLDTKAPSGTVAINNKALYTNSRTVDLGITALDAGSGLSGVCVKESAIPCAPGEFVPFAAAMSFAITSPGDGKKTIHVTLKDNVGKNSPPALASIILDTLVPTGTITITAGKPTAANPLVTPVTLKLTAVKASQMMFSFDGGVTFDLPVKFALTRKLLLTTGSGLNTVTVKFRDLAGNESAPISAGITL